MSDVVAGDEWRTKKVRDWLLVILRFAVTLHDTDRSAVPAIAEEIDKLGRRREGRSAFKFFATRVSRSAPQYWRSRIRKEVRTYAFI